MGFYVSLSHCSEQHHTSEKKTFALYFWSLPSIQLYVKAYDVQVAENWDLEYLNIHLTYRDTFLLIYQTLKNLISLVLAIACLL